MKNNIVSIMLKILALLVVIAGIVFGVYVYSNANENAKKENKLESEIDYLDTKITSLINKLNGIILQNYKISISKVEEEQGSTNTDTTDKENSKKEETGEDDESKEETTISKMEEEKTVEEGEIDWDWIQGETEILYSSWGAIVLDLYDAKIDSGKIVGFSNTLDQTLISVKQKDKAMSAGYFAKLYNFISEFANTSDIPELKKNVIMTKNHIINAYAYVQEEIWDKVQGEVVNAESDFTKVINNIENSANQKKYSINKTYILIGELKNSLATKDQEIFYIKYKNLLEQINALM